jgi:glycosyltransferase involved in cell wall biosynthesis
LSTLLVSVIIPNYNYSQYLSQAIDSVLAQSYPLVEVIVVDDGSTDDSIAKLWRYGKQIRYVQQQNKGVAAARNRGVQESVGELIAFLDSDDLWLPSKIEKQIEQFNARPELGLIHCGVIEFNEQTGRETRRLDGQQGWVANELLLLQRPVILGGGSGLMIRRKIYQEIGGFDTDFSTSADWDLFYQIARRYQIGFIAEPLVMYRMHDSNMHSNVNVMEHDMLLGFQKAFSSASTEVRSLRRRAYAKLHLILAGSYFQAGQTRDFLRHFGRSLLFSPEGIGYLLKYPFRQRERLKIGR